VEEADRGGLVVTISYTQAITPGVSYSLEALRESIKKMRWLEYEVAPEWQRFCSFGPEDMGSVWEEIGAIRKRPRISMIVVSEEMVNRMNKAVENEVLFKLTGYGATGSLGVPRTQGMLGIPMMVSPYLNGSYGYLVKGDSV
jgi:hypothetical protein